MDPTVAQAAVHWSALTRNPPAGKGRWWQHPAIRAHVNKLISGEASPGVVDGDARVIRRLAGRALPLGVSIGCGDGSKEMALLRAGVVEGFELYEVAEARVQQGEAHARKLGLADRVSFRREVVDFAGGAPAYDLVYWNNALHHMLDTPAAVAWSRRVLRPRGVFYINDYVGPDRMQFTEPMNAAGAAVRAGLPDRLLAGPHGPLPREVKAVDLAHLLATDPTECADAERILPAVRSTFPDAEVILTGGVIYHAALNDVLANWTADDAELLYRCLAEDAQLAERGLTHYAVAWATV